MYLCLTGGIHSRAAGRPLPSRLRQEVMGIWVCLVRTNVIIYQCAPGLAYARVKVCPGDPEPTPLIQKLAICLSESRNMLMHNKQDTRHQGCKIRITQMPLFACRALRTTKTSDQDIHILARTSSHKISRSWH